MKTAQPKISVIIPTYNCGKFIAESVNSALLQSLKPYEIIIIDDGSTDNTEAVVRSFSCEKIQYIRIPNGGVSGARNHGLNLASGEFIAFLDADDRWSPNMLQTQAYLLTENPRAVFSFTNFNRFDHLTGNILSDQFSFYPEIKESENIHLDGNNGTITDAFNTLVAFGEFPAYVQCIMFRHSLISILRFNENLKICEDAEFVLKAALLGEVMFCKISLAEIRRHESNATRTFDLLSINKLDALKSLETKNLTKIQRAALNDRIVRAHIDIAVALIKQRKTRAAIATAADAVPYRGSLKRKLKGCLRILFTVLQYSFDRTEHRNQNNSNGMTSE